MASNPPPANSTPTPAPTDNGVSKTRRIIWQDKIGPAFWTIASTFSIVLNIVLFALLIILGRELFTLKYMVGDQLIGGLFDNFQKMDQAHIVTTIRVQDTITVNDTISVVFDLPLQQQTTVVLTQDTPVDNATIFLNGQAVPLDIILRKGTKLNIALDLTVPVNTQIPVVLNVPVDLQVPVDIPLNQTDLHQPFTGLQTVVLPYYTLLQSAPASWQDLPFCGKLTGWLCRLYFTDRELK